MMQNKLISPHKDAMGRMLLDYLGGEHAAAVQVFSPHLDMAEMTGELMCRSFSEMNNMEQLALETCRGRVLDVGGGSGCHSLHLQDQGMAVTALDISPGCVTAMEMRGVTQVHHQSLTDLTDGPWDTVLMLMNGIGLCGSLEGLDTFFEFLHTLLAPGGQLLADSTDLGAYADLVPEGDRDVLAAGSWETEFTVTYDKMTSDPFDWLYIDFDTLARIAAEHGFHCEELCQGEMGQFLARILKQD